MLIQQMENYYASQNAKQSEELQSSQTKNSLYSNSYSLKNTLINKQSQQFIQVESSASNLANSKSGVQKMEATKRPSQFIKIKQKIENLKQYFQEVKNIAELQPEFAGSFQIENPGQLYLQRFKVQQNILTDNDDVYYCSNQILDSYYNKLIDGVDYQELSNKSVFFTPFVKKGQLRFFKYNFKRELIDGDGFGDHGFFNNIKHNDAMVCTSDVMFATINKNQFYSYNKKVQKLKIQKIMGCMKKSIYSFINDSQILEKIAQLYTKQKYHKGNIVFTENDKEIDCCYIIYKGEVLKMKKK